MLKLAKTFAWIADSSHNCHKLLAYWEIRNMQLTCSQLFLEANKMRALEFFTSNFEKFGRALWFLIVRQSLKLTAPQINSAAHSWLYQSPKIIIFLQTFLVRGVHVFPTFRVGYYAGKPTESVGYCFYKIKLKQNILCVKFLWVTDAMTIGFWPIPFIYKAW